MFYPSIPEPLQRLVDRELERNERVEWIGQPRATFFTPGATAMFLFGIPWTSFAIFWTVMAAWGTSQLEEGAGPFNAFPLFGLPFILIGCGMLSAPIWARIGAKKTAYVITDRRAITFEGGWSTTIRSYPPEKLTDIYRKEKRDGSGDVIIDRRAWRDSDGDRRTNELGFMRVEDAKDIERRLKALAAKSDAAE